MTTDLHLRNRDLDVAQDQQVIFTEGMTVYDGTEYIYSDETIRKRSISNRNKDLLRAIFVEFLGTLFYVFITTDLNYLLAPGFVSLMVAFGKISGGHFNPAITLAVSISSGFSKTTIFYPIAQIIGGIAGAGLTKAVHFSFEDHSHYRTVLDRSVEPEYGIICEGLITFILVITYLMSIIDKRNKDSSMSPIAIGFVVAANHFATFRVTGGSMNPARSFGPVVCMSNTQINHIIWKYHYVYWVGPTAGSIIAAVVYRLI
ncbi:aquaporin-8 [Mytilus galloprovincialis]|uniref:Aquaporin-8 n=1 Tax=Mytilus galloprovincialis TaxID=29158 RepID=A0A8B6HAN3_MYTGA|nr:aquaporin-8 [Mytilus galloprovincialis]